MRSSAGCGSVLVVGAGHRFYSGVSVYTSMFTRALHEAGVPVRAVLFRNLCPVRLYPGRSRVGEMSLEDLAFPSEVAVSDELDWWPSLGSVRVWLSVLRYRPSLLVLQWWSSATLFQYVVVSLLVRLRGGRVVVVMHESMDVGEAGFRLARGYVRVGMSLLAGLASAGVVHSEEDREVFPAKLPLGGLPLHVVRHGPYPVELIASGGGAAREVAEELRAGARDGSVEEGCPAGDGSVPEDGSSSEVGGQVRLLMFGVLRAYKGLDVLEGALGLLPEGFSVSVVGERWDDVPSSQLDALRASGVRVVDRYVSGAELSAELAAADVVVLPYLRASASGPLAVAMAEGLPVVVSDLPQLRSEASGYAGAVLVAPGDVEALAEGILEASRMVGVGFECGSSWRESVSAVVSAAGFADPYEALGEELVASCVPAGEGSGGAL